VVIIDPIYDHWYLVNYGTARDFPNEYYKSKNQMTASNRNFSFHSGKHREVKISDFRFQISDLSLFRGEAKKKIAQKIDFERFC
jgi:hypothetical protein